MSTPPPLPLSRSPAKALGVFAIFVIVGPLLAVVFAIGILPFFGGSFLPQDVGSFIFGIGRLMNASYSLGSLQAAAIGLVAALWLFVLRTPRIPLLLIVLLSLAIAAFAAVLVEHWSSAPGPDLGVALAILILHVGPAIGCGLIANRLLRSTANGTPAVAP